MRTQQVNLRCGMKPVLMKASQLYRKRLNPKLVNMEWLHRLRFFLHTNSFNPYDHLG